MKLHIPSNKFTLNQNFLKIMSFFLTFRDKEFGIIPLEVHTMKKIQRHTTAAKFLHYQPLSEEQFVIISEGSKHCADLYEMTSQKPIVNLTYLSF